ncbi:hypothetical protein GCM10028792_20430 [Salinisphaera aquimarina]
MVNVAALQRIGLVPPEVVRDKIGREYQRVKRPILQVIAEDRDSPMGVNRIMVTSAKPGEGKSFTSLNLALSLAQELDHTVLLVDGDVASPRLSRALGLGKDPGLIDTLLSDDISAEQVIRTTDIPRLSVMPAGRRYDQATELMASRRMRRLVDELAADSRRIVLFDSAPLLATAESQALAMTMGQIIFVVKAGHTERRALDSALSLLDQSSARVSLLLNQSRAAYGDDYDGYYGAYGGGVNGTSQL